MTLQQKKIKKLKEVIKNLNKGELSLFKVGEEDIEKKNPGAYCYNDNAVETFDAKKGLYGFFKESGMLSGVPNL